MIHLMQLHSILSSYISSVSIGMVSKHLASFLASNVRKFAHFRFLKTTKKGVDGCERRKHHMIHLMGIVTILYISISIQMLSKCPPFHFKLGIN